MTSIFRNLILILGKLLTRGGYVLRQNIMTVFFRIVLENCGNRTRFGHGVYMFKPKGIQIGQDCYIGNEVLLNSETKSGTLTIGDHVEIQACCKIDFSGGLEMQDRAFISSETTIYTHDHGYDPRSAPKFSPLVICENAWLGSRSIILPSVARIGRNSIVGAGSVVTKSVPDNTIVAGNPATVVKHLDNK